MARRKCKCGKAQPHFNEPGKTKPICCSTCKTATMVDVRHKRCKGQSKMCPQAGNPKYRGYCAFCFGNMFPTDPLTFKIRTKTKENTVRDFINTKFEGFVHDKPLYTAHCDCTVRRRVDHRRLIGNTMLAIETDENAHKSYDKMDEETRYHDLMMGFTGKWIYIRFNPDKYKTKSGKTLNPPLLTRLEKLGTVIENQINKIRKGENTELVERYYLFYDETREL